MQTLEALGTGFRRGLVTISKQVGKITLVPEDNIALPVTPILTFPIKGEGTFEIVS